MGANSSNEDRPFRNDALPGETANITVERGAASRRADAENLRRGAEQAARDDIKANDVGASDSFESKPFEPGLRRELGALLKAILQRGRRWPIIRLVSAVFLVLIVNMLGQVRLNAWNGAFFDAVEKKSTEEFVFQLGVFLLIVSVLLTVVVLQTWFQERLKVRIRERLSEVLMDRWLKPGLAYQLGFAGQGGAAPDQRMQEDSRLAAEMSTELGVGALQSSLLLISFIGVLWGLSSQVTFTIRGHELSIPGYMVWVAIGYAAIGSSLTWAVGRPLIRLNTERYAREAELRFALVRVNESAESVAFYSGEADERRLLDETLQSVLAALRRVSNALSRLTWITSGYGWVAIVVPIIAAAPGYFSGQLSFGGLMMVVGAFQQVQSALNWFVVNFPRIADWRSAIRRVSIFYAAMDNLETATAEAARITLKPHPEGRLSFEGLRIALADGSIVIEQATAEIGPQERVLIAGESGSGKSTLFRAVAGLWPWGEGTILHPPRESMMFLPQRPYLPLGSLKAAVCYPEGEGAFDDANVRAALARCGLDEFVEEIHTQTRWDKTLSLGQQQKLAFARLLLHRPAWVFLDEATAALDDENQARVMSLFEEDLVGTTVLSIAHRPGLEQLHTRTLTLQKTEHGAILFGPHGRSTEIEPLKPWQKRIGRWLGDKRPGSRWQGPALF